MLRKYIINSNVKQVSSKKKNGKLVKESLQFFSFKVHFTNSLFEFLMKCIINES